MAKVIASITMSLDGYIAGPQDGPDQGLGIGGERLHYWVFGGPWSSDDPPQGGFAGFGAEYLDEVTKRIGAMVVGRWMYESSNHWGERNPFGIPLFVVTHRPEEEPDSGEFRFVNGLAEAIGQAKEAAGGKDVSLGGGADVIRQGLASGLVDELALVVAPFTLGGGKSLFDGFEEALEFEPIRTVPSEWANVLEYRVKR